MIPLSGTSPLLAELDLDRPWDLRLLTLDHPHLPRLRRNEIGLWKQCTEKHAVAFLGVEVRIRHVGSMPLGEFLRRGLSPKEREELHRWEFPLEDHPKAMDSLSRALREGRDPPDLQGLLPLPQDHPALHHPGPSSKPQEGSLWEQAARFHLYAIGRFLETRLPGGMPLIEDPLWVGARTWEQLASKQEGIDLILTPLPLLTTGFPVSLPESLRGGINAGLVAAHCGQLQGVVVFSSYPFLARDEVMEAFRGPPPPDPVEIMALCLTHELGHLLRRWAHAWDHPPGCPMRPALDPDYRSWAQRVREHGPCRLPHPSMRSFQ